MNTKTKNFLASLLILGGSSFWLSSCGNASSPPTPATINLGMSKFCINNSESNGITDVIAFLGQNSFPSMQKEDGFVNSAGGLLCETGRILGITVETWFFRTAFDENSSITNLNKHYLVWDKQCDVSTANPNQFYVGKGFIGFFIYPQRSCAKTHKITEGVTASLIGKIFNTTPVTTGYLQKQNWNDLLPPLNISSFGNPKPHLSKN